VVEGCVLRQSPDNTHPDSPDYPQQRGCARGRSLRHAVFAADRLKYPLKRKHWQPGGGDASNGQLRGCDEWERISWDEALDLVAQRFTEIREAQGGDALAAFACSRSTNEDVYLLQKMARTSFKTNNIDNCARV
jgi:anaerobic dimethyl sulfoxide reductase subunit A